MSKKDYELIARVLKNSSPTLPKKAFKLLCESFCDELEATNPLFKREVFIKACGL